MYIMVQNTREATLWPELGAHFEDIEPHGLEVRATYSIFRSHAVTIQASILPELHRLK
jgi:hypothetical protein